MVTLTMNPHNAIKNLKESGIDENQAEKIVEVIACFHDAGAATKDDLKSAVASLKRDIDDVKGDIDGVKRDISVVRNDLAWIKTLLLTVGIAAAIAALKYVFLG